MANQLLQNYTKIIYGEPVEVLPEVNTIAEALAFSQEYKTGDKYVCPIRMADEQGFTYNADHSGFPLKPPKDGNIQRAELEGSEIVGRAHISYGNMSKLSETNAESRKAYKQAVGDTIESVMNSAERRRELALMYGPGPNPASGAGAGPGAANLGSVDTVVGTIAAGDTSGTVRISRATWAAGLWPLFRGAGFDFHSSGGTKLNTSELVLTGVVQSQNRLTFSGVAGEVNVSLVAGATISFAGSREVSCVGIEGILDNQGMLFNIDAAQFPQWKASTYPVTGPLTFDKVVEGLILPANNGLTTGGTLFLPNAAWTDCMTDEAALRRHVGSRMASSVKTGSSQLEFETNCGVVKLVTHPFMKQGQAWFIPTEYAKRVGSRELSFKLPGNPNEWFFKEVDGAAASEIRCYGDQAPLIERPNLCVKYTGIASTGDNVPS